MADDTVKDISLAIPSAPVQAHPQNVSYVRRRWKKRDESHEGEGGGREEGEGGLEYEDRVNISSAHAIEEMESEKEGSSSLGGVPEKEEIDMPKIDIKV